MKRYEVQNRNFIHCMIDEIGEVLVDYWLRLVTDIWDESLRSISFWRSTLVTKDKIGQNLPNLGFSINYLTSYWICLSTSSKPISTYTQANKLFSSKNDRCFLRETVILNIIPVPNDFPSNEVYVSWWWRTNETFTFRRNSRWLRGKKIGSKSRTVILYNFLSNGFSSRFDFQMNLMNIRKELVNIQTKYHLLR